MWSSSDREFVFQRDARVHSLTWALTTLVGWLMAAPVLAQHSFLEMLHQKPNELTPQSDVGFKVAPGFEVETLATDAVTPNARSLTMDPAGQIVVSGPGYIRKLLDQDGDGAIDEWTHFATTKSGAFGMVFVGSRLFALADDALAIYMDRDGDHQADGLPETLISINTGHDAARRIRVGPDGALYILGGAGTDWSQLQDELSLNSSEVESLGGAIIRFLPDGSEFEVYVRGLEAPVDFAFDNARRLVVLDSETPLPNIASWKRPARLTVAQPYTDHGARKGELGPLFPRHPRSLESPAPFFTFDEGRPVAAAFYQSDRLPNHFHDGLFVVDWAIGRLVYLPMVSTPGGGYELEQPNLLFEPVEGSGYTPSDLTVAPDGTLLFTTGDHGTPGGVFRFDMAGAIPSADPKSELEAALDAPEPLEAWSQRNQNDIIDLLGKKPIAEAALRDDLPIPQRVRAVELLYRNNGLAIDLLQKLAGASDPEIRSATAWALNGHSSPKTDAILLALLFDLDAETRLTALNAWAADPSRISGDNAAEALRRLLGDPYLRVRFGAAQLAARLPAPLWDEFQRRVRIGQPDMKIATYFANILRAESGELVPNLEETGFQLTREIKDSGRRFQSLSLWIRAMGDWDLETPGLTIHERPFRTPPSAAVELEGDGSLEDIEKFVRSAIPSGDALLDMEIARLSAMRPGTDPLVVAKLVTRARVAKSNAERLHYINALSRLEPVAKTTQRHQLTEAILALNASTPSLPVNPNGDPHQWIRGGVGPLLHRDPELANALIERPDFFVAPRLELVEALPPEPRQKAVERFSSKLDPDRITGAPHRALARILSLAPLSETRDDLEKLWKFPSLRNDIVKAVARNPTLDSISFFLEGLESGQRTTVLACLRALKTLELGEQRAQVLARLIRTLRRSVYWTEDDELRRAVLTTISVHSGEPMGQSEEMEFLAIDEALENVETWFENTYPDDVNTIQIDPRDDRISIKANLAAVDWSSGKIDPGAVLFSERNCAQCHARPARFGPELQNHPLLENPEALMMRVIFPHKEITPGFEARLIQMDTGESFYGFVAPHTDREPLILRTGPNAARRLSIDRITFTEFAPFSVMPGGLLQGLNAQDVANLHAYMTTL